MPNALKELNRYGQSVWLDYIRRSLIVSGELRRLIDEDGLRGVTSNPAIFEKAIAGSTDYEAQLKELTKRRDLDAKGAYEIIAVHDIQDVADILRPIHESSGRRDGYVSLEVSPDLANDTGGTLDEARRLWTAVSRSNVMIKVPATPAGVPAIKTLIGEGINVNVTLLFHLDAYEAVAEAYVSGLEALVAKGGDPRKVESVASFFISRIDSAIDGMIEARLKASDDAMEQALLKGLLGRVAIANAKLTYQRYKDIYLGERWAKLAGEVKTTLKTWGDGGRVQRLWARDAALWTDADEGRRLGWLGTTDDQLALISHLKQAAENAKSAGFTHALLIGMGGTVLGVEALAKTFGKTPGFPELHLIDSTDPAQVQAIERKLDLARTVVIVSSKSGSTLEPNALREYFFERMKAAVGPAEAGKRFMAITDAGSKMQYAAEAHHF